MFLLFEGVCPGPVQCPLLSFSVPSSLTLLPAVHCFFASGRVFYLKQGISWLPATIAAFVSQSFCQVASGSPATHLSPFISLSIPLPLLNEQIVHIISPSCFCPAFIPPLFLVSLLQLFPLDHPPVLAQASLPLAAAVRGHQDLHFVSLKRISGPNGTVIFT
jgi:hypothetical protein